MSEAKVQMWGLYRYEKYGSRRLRLQDDVGGVDPRMTLEEHKPGVTPEQVRGRLKLATEARSKG